MGDKIIYAIKENIPFRGLVRFIIRRLGLGRFIYKQDKRFLETREIGGPTLQRRCIEEFELMKRLHIEKYDISAYLDIGGNVGQNTISSRKFFEKSVPLYTFEPSDNCFEILNQIAGNYENTYLVKAGAGEVTEEKVFHVSHSSDTSQASSFLQYTEKYKHEYPEQAQYSEVVTKVYALDDFFSNKWEKLGENVFLHIDTEGFEIYVLRGATELLKRTKVIILEITFGLFENEGSFEKVFDLLREDFIFKGCLDPLVISESGESLFQDALFVRK